MLSSRRGPPPPPCARPPGPGGGAGGRPPAEEAGEPPAWGRGGGPALVGPPRQPFAVAGKARAREGRRIVAEGAEVFGAQVARVLDSRGGGRALGVLPEHAQERAEPGARGLPI